MVTTERVFGTQNYARQLLLYMFSSPSHTDYLRFKFYFHQYLRKITSTKFCYFGLFFLNSNIIKPQDSNKHLKHRFIVSLNLLCHGFEEV